MGARKPPGEAEAGARRTGGAGCRPIRFDPRLLLVVVVSMTRNARGLQGGESASVGEQEEEALVYFEGGRQLLQQHSLREGMQAYAKGLSLSPASAAAWDEMGVAHFDLGERRTAIRCFQVCIRLAPQDRDAEQQQQQQQQQCRYHLIEALRAVNDFAAALAASSAAVRPYIPATQMQGWGGAAEGGRAGGMPAGKVSSQAQVPPGKLQLLQLKLLSRFIVSVAYVCAYSSPRAGIPKGPHITSKRAPYN